MAEWEDVALILHTSGTTSQPKMVPLTQSNVVVSAGNIARTVEFMEGDRGLNIMPLFHIQGLIAGLLAPLLRGGGAFDLNSRPWRQSLEGTIDRLLTNREFS